MRIVGMFLLGFGITLLIASGIALYVAEDLLQVLGVLVCAGLVPFPMLLGGIAIVRSVEDGAVPPPEEPDAAPVATGTGNPISRILTQMQQFELDRLNWVGWLLLLATFGFVMAEASVCAVVLGQAPPQGRWWARLIGLGMVLLAIGFFAGLRWLLHVIGISIYRRQGEQ